MAKRPLPSRDVLRQMVHYEPETGEMTWKARTKEHIPDDRVRAIWNTRFANKPAFMSRMQRGYKYSPILGTRCYAHRVAWKIIHDEDPDVIDHIDGNPDNNRISNLRSVTQADNCRNQRMNSRNTSGYAGVYFDKPRGKWYVRFKKKERNLFCGYFKTCDEARTARKDLEVQAGYHPNHGQSQAEHITSSVSISTSPAL